LFLKQASQPWQNLQTAFLGSKVAANVARERKIALEATLSVG